MIFFYLNPRFDCKGHLETLGRHSYKKIQFSLSAAGFNAVGAIEAGHDSTAGLFFDVGDFAKGQ